MAEPKRGGFMHRKEYEEIVPARFESIRKEALRNAAAGIPVLTWRATRAELEGDAAVDGFRRALGLEEEGVVMPAAKAGELLARIVTAEVEPGWDEREQARQELMREEAFRLYCELEGVEPAKAREQMGLVAGDAPAGDGGDA